MGNAVSFGELKKPSPERVELRAAVDRVQTKTERPHNDSNCFLFFCMCTAIPRARPIHRRTVTVHSDGSSTQIEAQKGSGGPRKGTPKGIPKQEGSIVTALNWNLYTHSAVLSTDAAQALLGEFEW